MTLPQFRDDAETALATAQAAEEAGLDGVFVFDHLWPMGRPGRPALYSHALVGALAVETKRVRVGTLVARIGLLPNAVLVNALATAHRMLGDRLIAGLGVGDHLSREENVAFAVDFAPAAERLAGLADCCRRLRELGITTWVGGLSDAVRRVSEEQAVPLNRWGIPPEQVRPGETWAGQVDLSTTDVAGRLDTLRAAGAAWAVVAPVGVPWPDAIAVLSST